MSNQQDQQQQQRNRDERRRNLNLDFSLPHEQRYNQQRGERRPIQSGFVSSTSWTYSDSEVYREQTTTPTNGPVQNPEVTCSRDVGFRSWLRRSSD